MAQLSDDCFAFGGKLADLNQAQTQLRASAHPIGGEEIQPLAELAGRVLSKNVSAASAVPPFHNSAVDGFAYVHGTGPELFITGSAPAGADIPPPLEPNCATRVLTGAPIPPNADTVVMDEDATVSANGTSLIVPSALNKGSNWRPMGEDIGLGTQLYAAGHTLDSLDLARLAAGGITHAAVYPRLRIHVLSSGDELINGQIADANRWILQAIFSGPRFDLSFGGVIADDLDQSLNALGRIDADLILTSGGVSVGERDFLRSAIETLGQIEFWRVGIKPGRPVAFGHIGAIPILGLPGNPVACFVTALFLARVFADASLGTQNTVPTFAARIASDLRKKPDRTEFIRVTLSTTNDLIPTAHPYPIAGAGVISSVTSADALVILNADQTRVSAGDLVTVVPLKGLMQ